MGEASGLADPTPLEAFKAIVGSELYDDNMDKIEQLAGKVKEVLPRIVAVALFLNEGADDVEAVVVDALRGKLLMLVDAILLGEGEALAPGILPLIDLPAERKGGDELPPLQALAAALGLNNEDEDPEDI